MTYLWQKVGAILLGYQSSAWVNLSSMDVYTRPRTRSCILYIYIYMCVCVCRYEVMDVNNLLTNSWWFHCTKHTHILYFGKRNWSIYLFLCYDSFFGGCGFCTVLLCIWLSKAMVPVGDFLSFFVAIKYMFTQDIILLIQVSGTCRLKKLFCTVSFNIQSINRK